MLQKLLLTESSGDVEASVAHSLSSSEHLVLTQDMSNWTLRPATFETEWDSADTSKSLLKYILSDS